MMNKSNLALIHVLFAFTAICITTFSNAQTDPQTIGVFQNSNEDSISIGGLSELSDCFIYRGEPCLGDFDSNGIITISDVMNVLGEFGCLLDCEYDLDSDGTISINDLLILLQLLGSTC